MNNLCLLTLLAGLAAVPALAQVSPPAGPNAPPVTNAIIAHHDRAAARYAARHGQWRRAARANRAANVAAAEANNPR